MSHTRCTQLQISNMRQCCIYFKMASMYRRLYSSVIQMLYIFYKQRTRVHNKFLPFSILKYIYVAKKNSK